MKLTDRQRDVAELAAQGLGDREIGERLGISPSTVRTFVTQIAKLLPDDGTKGLRRIMRWAMTNSVARATH